MKTKIERENLKQDFPQQAAMIVPPEQPEEEKKDEFYAKVYDETDMKRNQRHIKEQGIENLIARAIDKGVTVDTIERLLVMRRELKAEYAKEKYDRAMAAFQAACPIIKKDKAGGRTQAGQVAYYYAPLESIVGQTKELIEKHGFSYAVETYTETDKVKVVCVATHVDGHSNPSSVELPLGTKTNVMSATQQVAAAITFAKRYAFCNAFGILTGDEDTDSVYAIAPTRPTAPVQRTFRPVTPLRTGYASTPTPIADQALMDGYKVTIVRQLGELGLDTSTKQTCADGVMLFANLPLEERHFAEIVNRLSAELKTRAK